MRILSAADPWTREHSKGHGVNDKLDSEEKGNGDDGA
jgi:hypothetical protein